MGANSLISVTALNEGSHALLTPIAKERIIKAPDGRFKPFPLPPRLHSGPQAVLVRAPCPVPEPPRPALELLSRVDLPARAASSPSPAAASREPKTAQSSRETASSSHRGAASRALHRAQPPERALDRGAS